MQRERHGVALQRLLQSAALGVHRCCPCLYAPGLPSRETIRFLGYVSVGGVTTLTSLEVFKIYCLSQEVPYPSSNSSETNAHPAALPALPRCCPRHLDNLLWQEPAQSPRRSAFADGCKSPVDPSSRELCWKPSVFCGRVPSHSWSLPAWAASCKRAFHQRNTLQEIIVFSAREG